MNKALLNILLEHVPPFHRKVYVALCKVPEGKVVTYAELARRAGSPGAARAVGQAMAKNPWPIVIPCHRVVPSSGKMGGYSGRGGVPTKQKLLALEAASKSASKNDA